MAAPMGRLALGGDDTEFSENPEQRVKNAQRLNWPCINIGGPPCGGNGKEMGFLKLPPPLQQSQTLAVFEASQEGLDIHIDSIEIAYGVFWGNRGLYKEVR